MNVSPKLSKIRCRTCLRDIENECYIICTKCKTFSQCLECFNLGIESGTHLKTHSFIVAKTPISPIFDNSWSHEDELFLLDAISKFGFGNWEGPSKLLKRSAQECRDHYFLTYLSSSNPPFPDLKVRLSESKEPDVIYPITRPFPAEGSPPDLKSKNKNQKTTPAEFLGYMPKRHEFEVVYNPDAEEVMNGLEFSEEEEDDEESFDKKLSVILSYNNQLKERSLRTEIIESSGLLYNTEFSFGGETPTEKTDDSNLVPIIPYFGFDKTKKLSLTLRDYKRMSETLYLKKLMASAGVESFMEMAFYQQLFNFVEDDKIPEEMISQWNDTITSFEKLQMKEQDPSSNLSKDEWILCTKYKITEEVYFKIKDLLIRECMATGSLSLEEACELDKEHANEIKKIYKFFVKSGWIY
ncbi:Myb-like DNA-binding domain containing protein [Histomonas meleagridis]|uniref:Myb-like DNA-binding domain containing protein n=1 Tax=Histomonas meleagridis TaxID=135588 RepID=UPI00355937B4|nr:Myb-like DNA-binding domain containing protein [Histomonas meleagridis]KAH0804450.1 Myb-like DNA-binding domain containing protein [Histomonas meleagridis]